MRCQPFGPCPTSLSTSRPDLDHISAPIVPIEHWYIYYKLPAGQVAPVAAAVRDMQRLVAVGGVSASLQMRVDGAGGVATLMECYSGVADAASFAARLDAAVAVSEVPGELQAGRRVERFAEL